jgi:hypothetical protein
MAVLWGLTACADPTAPGLVTNGEVQQSAAAGARVEGFSRLCDQLAEGLGTLSPDETLRHAFEARYGAFHGQSIDDVWSAVRLAWKERDPDRVDMHFGHASALFHHTRSIQPASVDYPRIVVSDGDGFLLAIPGNGRDNVRDSLELIGVRCDAEHGVRFEPAHLEADQNSDGAVRWFAEGDDSPAEVRKAIAEALHDQPEVLARLSQPLTVRDACGTCHGRGARFRPIMEEYDLWPGAMFARDGAWGPNAVPSLSRTLDIAWLKHLQDASKQDPSAYTRYEGVLQPQADAQADSGYHRRPIDLLTHRVYQAMHARSAHEIATWTTHLQPAARTHWLTAFHQLLTRQAWTNDSDRPAVVSSLSNIRPWSHMPQDEIATHFAQLMKPRVDAFAAVLSDKRSRHLDALAVLQEELGLPSQQDELDQERALVDNDFLLTTALPILFTPALTFLQECRNDQDQLLMVWDWSPTGAIRPRSTLVGQRDLAPDLNMRDQRETWSGMVQSAVRLAHPDDRASPCR